MRADIDYVNYNQSSIVDNSAVGITAGILLNTSMSATLTDRFLV